MCVHVCCMAMIVSEYKSRKGTMNGGTKDVLKKWRNQSREIAQGLRTFVALPKDPGSIPRTICQPVTVCNSCSSVPDTSFVFRGHETSM